MLKNGLFIKFFADPDHNKKQGTNFSYLFNYSPCVLSNDIFLDLWCVLRGTAIPLSPLLFFYVPDRFSVVHDLSNRPY